MPFKGYAGVGDVMLQDAPEGQAASYTPFPALFSLTTPALAATTTTSLSIARLRRTRAPRSPPRHGAQRTHTCAALISPYFVGMNIQWRKRGEEEDALHRTNTSIATLQPPSPVCKCYHCRIPLPITTYGISMGNGQRVRSAAAASVSRQVTAADGTA